MGGSAPNEFRPTRWPLPTAILISVAACGYFDILLSTNPTLALDDARATSLYSSVVTVLALVISVGALTYVEYLKYSGGLYNDFVQSISNITTDPETSAVAPPMMKAMIVKAGFTIPPDQDFYELPTWEDVARATQLRIKDVTRVMDSLFYWLVGISGFGIVSALLSTITQTVLYQLLLSLDFGVAGVVFFALLLMLFAVGRKSSLELFPITVAPSGKVNPNDKEENK